MDPQRFDTLARSLQDVRSRRGTLIGVLVGALGLFGMSGNDAEAKNCKKIKNKKKRKKCLARARDTSPPSCPDGQRLCRGVCQSNLICCDNSDCAGGRTCQQGACACPSAAPHLCAGSNLCQQCCTNDHCATDRTCQLGTCVRNCLPPDSTCPGGEAACVCSRVVNGFVVCSEIGTCSAGETCSLGDISCPTGQVCVVCGSEGRCSKVC